MDRRVKLLKDMMGPPMMEGPRSRVPYLLCPQNKKPEDYSEEEKSWLKKREEGRKGYTPTGWWNYYKDCVQVKIRDGDSLALWLSASTEEEVEITKDSLPFILFLHGGGYSGLTWASIIDELSRLIVAEYGALDLRSHGESECEDQDNLSLESLTQDVLDAIEWMSANEQIQLKKRPLVLIGHSMGGALAVNVSLQMQQEADSVRLAGMAVLDVVEGSAMLALNSMHFVLKNRPQEFACLPEAIQWCVRSGQTKNLDAARISMMGQLMQKGTGVPATSLITRNKDEGCEEQCDTYPAPSGQRIWRKDKDAEPHIHNFQNNGTPGPGGDGGGGRLPFEWRIDLSKTEPHWKGWFEGLSKKFLSVRCPKLLMLAGVDRLDKELTVGQMQGKFQMQVFHQVGHAVHEDAPDKAAECVASFLCRQRVAKSKGNLPAAHPGC